MTELDKLVQERQAWMAEHLRTYLDSGGKEGHLVDLSDLGGRGPTTTLVLKTIGRQSGKELMVPLIYGKVGEEYAVIGSKAGAPEHPSWFLNLTARPQAQFQVAEQRWRGTWRIATGEERKRVWHFMADLYPPFIAYQQNTNREIPVVLLRPAEAIASL